MLDFGRHILTFFGPTKTPKRIQGRPLPVVLVGVFKVMLEVSCTSIASNNQ